MENATQTQTKTLKSSPAKLAYNKAHYQSHKEEYKANYKAYYQSHKEEMKAYHKDYRSSHREEKKAYNKAYYAENDIYRQIRSDYQKKYKSKVPAALTHRIREWLDDNGYISYVGHHYDYQQPFKVIILPKNFHSNLHSYLEKVEVDGFETYQRKSDKHLMKDAKEALNYADFLLKKDGFEFKPFILDFEGLFPTVIEI